MSTRSSSARPAHATRSSTGAGKARSKPAYSFIAQAPALSGKKPPTHPAMRTRRAPRNPDGARKHRAAATKSKPSGAQAAAPAKAAPEPASATEAADEDPGALDVGAGETRGLGGTAPAVDEDAGALDVGAGSAAGTAGTVGTAVPAALEGEDLGNVVKEGSTGGNMDLAVTAGTAGTAGTTPVAAHEGAARGLGDGDGEGGHASADEGTVQIEVHDHPTPPRPAKQPQRQRVDSDGDGDGGRSDLEGRLGANLAAMRRSRSAVPLRFQRPEPRNGYARTHAEIIAPLAGARGGSRAYPRPRKKAAESEASRRERFRRVSCMAITGEATPTFANIEECLSAERLRYVACGTGKDGEAAKDALVGRWQAAGLSRREIQSFAPVGTHKYNRVLIGAVDFRSVSAGKNKPSHALGDADYDYIKLGFRHTVDGGSADFFGVPIEPGMPCPVKGLHWYLCHGKSLKDVHSGYRTEGAAVGQRTVTYAHFTTLVKRLFPKLKRHRMCEDLCDSCKRLELLLSECDLPAGHAERVSLEQALAAHLSAARTQRRANTAFAHMAIGLQADHPMLRYAS